MFDNNLNLSEFFFETAVKYGYIRFYNIVMNFFFILSIIWLTPFLLFFIFIKYYKKILCPPNWTKIFKVLYEVSNIKFILSFSGFAIISYIIINFVMFNNTFDNMPYGFDDEFFGNYFIYNDFVINNYKFALGNYLYNNKYNYNYTNYVSNNIDFTDYRLLYIHNRIEQNGKHFFLSFLVKGGFVFFKPALFFPVKEHISYFWNLSNANNNFLITEYFRYNNNFLITRFFEYKYKFPDFNEITNIKYYKDSIDNVYLGFTFYSQSRVKYYSVYIYLFLIILLILHILLGFLGLSYDYFLKNYSFINNFFLGFSWLQIFFIFFKIFFIIIV